MSAFSPDDIMDTLALMRAEMLHDRQELTRLRTRVGNLEIMLKMALGVSSREVQHK